MAASSDDSLYPIAVLIDELKNEEIQVSTQQAEEKNGVVRGVTHESERDRERE